MLPLVVMRALVFGSALARAPPTMSPLGLVSPGLRKTHAGGATYSKAATFGPRRSPFCKRVDALLQVVLVLERPQALDAVQDGAVHIFQSVVDQ